MAKDYTKNKATADRLIKKFGQALTLVKEAENKSGYDREGNAVAPDPDTTVDGYGVKLDYETRDIDGESILRGDAILLFSTAGVVDYGMKVNLDGHDWFVVDPGEFRPAGTIIMHEIQIRK